jgi:hypothetical protein
MPRRSDANWLANAIVAAHGIHGRARRLIESNGKELVDAKA